MTNQKNSVIFNNSKDEVITGLMFGDGNLQTFTDPPKSYRLRITSSELFYVNHLYSVFKDWTGTGIKQNTKTGVNYLNTLTRSELFKFGELFYIVKSPKKLAKILPSKEKINGVTNTKGYSLLVYGRRF